MVEIDLRRARDGAIVVLHDQTLDRLWGADASVGDLDLDQVRTVGAGEQRIPTLREVLEAVPVPLMVDFTRREVVAGALADVTEAGALERALFVTGNVPALRMLRSASAEARLGLTWTESTVPPLDLLDELGAEYWNPYHELLTPEGADAVHASGRLVSCWTVDDETDMARVTAAGADAVVSNRVADLIAFLQATGRVP
jgi:myo-inositol-1(or 4)-monophosphatase/deoxyribonuclease-2